MEENKSKKNKGYPRSRQIYWTLSVIGVVAVLAMILVSFEVLTQDRAPNDIDVLAAMGSYVGGLASPVIAFFALLALGETIRIQSTELEKSSKQLQISAKALEEQSILWQKQNFEQTFFHLLSLHREVFAGTEVLGGHHPVRHESGVIIDRDAYFVKGIEAFRVMASYLSSKLDLIGRDFPFDGSEDEWLDLRAYVVASATENFQEKFRDNIGPYVSSVFNLLHHVDRAALTEDEREHYTRLVRSQLSVSELCLIFYSFTGMELSEDLCFLALKFDMFLALQPSHLNDEKDHLLIDRFKLKHFRAHDKFPVA